MIGETVSHYRVLRVLGEGGMGVVYEAEDVRLGRHVALKFIVHKALDRPDRVVRFEREARAASVLNHPNICTVYDVGEAEGRHFIAMELLEGDNLDKLLEKGPLPVRRLLELRDAVAKTMQQFGRLDILVVNAGVLIRGGILEYRMEDLDRMLAVNVRGVVVAIQAAAAHMGQGGRVITIGSKTAVRTGFPGASIYSMTKGAIASLVRGVAIDLAPRGITVNNVQPGPTVTDMTSVPGMAEAVKPLIPLGRMGSTAEIAAMVAYLVGPESAFVTGASMTIDGGYVA